MTFLTRIALHKRWLTFLILALLTAASIFATLLLKMELIPDIEFPMSTVVTSYPGASPEVVMQQVTVPVEEAISGVKKPRHILSTSTEGVSVVYAEFEYGTDMDKVNQLIGERLAELDLPPDLPRELPQTGKNPQLFPLDLSMLPVVMLSLAGNVDPGELQQMAADIVPQLEDIDGVFSVSSEGGEEKVLITPDIQEMNANGIAMSELVSILDSSQYGSLDEIGETPLSDGIVLKDVAVADIGPAPGTAITRTDGKTSVGIMVMKEDDANTVAVANAVTDRAEEIQQNLGDGVSLLTVFDQSDYIESSISELTREALIGAVLAVIVIFLFLMTIRGSLVIGISIPLSIVIGFLVMYFWGITINLLTLSAMAIAVGRIVDNSIVVLEVIYRRMHQGEGFREAAINGVREVGGPITSSTIATVVIFIPLIFVGGIVGELFLPFALTITFTLIISLLVALMVVPPLSSFLVPRKLKGEPTGAWYQRAYVPVLRWSLTHRALTLVIAAVLFFGSFALMPIIGTSFLPGMSEKVLLVEIEMPLGTDTKATSEKAAEVEQIIASNPEVDMYYTTVGLSSSFAGGMSALMTGGGTNTASIETYLNDDANLEEERERLESQAQALAGESTITVSIMQSMMGESGTDLEVSVRGEDYQNVVRAAEDLSAELGSVDGLVNIERDIAQTLPSPSIQIDPARVMPYMAQGMNMTLLMTEVYGSMMRGADTGATFDGKKLFVQGIMRGAATAEDLGQLRVSGGLTQPIELSKVANVTVVMEATQIRRYDQARSATITATITKKDVGAVNRAVQQKIDAISSNYSGVQIEMGGVAEEMAETFRNMGIAIIVAILLAYAVMAIFFRSFLNPLIIMVSLPLASIGALLGLLVTGRTLDSSAAMGILMLVGIVLSNAIVLITLVEQLRKRGMSTYDSLIEGGRTRLRPILMTSLTTMIALVPLSLGLDEGILMAASLGTVVIGGLFTSTLLTLVVIPVVYSLVEGLRLRRRRRAS